MPENEIDCNMPSDTCMMNVRLVKAAAWNPHLILNKIVLSCFMLNAKCFVSVPNKNQLNDNANKDVVNGNWAF